MNSILFQPFQLHDLTLPNRIVLSPMTRARAGAARLPNRLMAEYYAQRSSAGLLITEATTISEEANGWNESPGIYTDEMTEGWKHTTNAVHEKGAGWSVTGSRRGAGWVSWSWGVAESWSWAA